MKVPTQEPPASPMPAPAPMPAGDDMGFSGEMPPAGPDMNAQPPMDGENPYDTNFDPGVDANEDEDPKKFIQQLTGKLSQSLRKYNEGLPQPDADLDKYVAGMILKQATEGLPQEDVKEILDKLEKDEEPQEPQDDMNQQPPMDGDPNQQPMGQDMPPAGPDQQPPMNENVSERSARLDNLYNQFTQDSEEKDITTKGRRKGYNRKAYNSPTWK